MKKFAFFFVLCGLTAVAFLAGCEEPIPELWTYSYSDSLAVSELLDSEQDFLTTQGYVSSAPVSLTLTAEYTDSVRADTAYTRYLVSAFSFQMTDTVLAYQLEASPDTTITAYVRDTLTGSIELTVDSLWEQGADSATVYDTTLSVGFRYGSLNGVYIDSAGNDAEWQISKYLGGSHGSTPDASEAPELSSVTLTYGSQTLTVTRADTAASAAYTVTGLYEPSDLIHISAGSSVTVDEIIQETTEDLVLYISHAGSWLPYTPGMELTFSAAGEHRFYVVGINPRSLLYAVEDYVKSVVWGIPVVVD